MNWSYISFWFGGRVEDILFLECVCYQIRTKVKFSSIPGKKTCMVNCFLVNSHGGQKAKTRKNAGITGTRRKLLQCTILLQNKKNCYLRKSAEYLFSSIDSSSGSGRLQILHKNINKGFFESEKLKHFWARGNLQRNKKYESQSLCSCFRFRWR